MENIEKAKTQVGATKEGKDGITRVYKEIKPGVFDWRKVKSGETKPKDKEEDKNSKSTHDKVKDHLKNTKTEELSKFANNPEKDSTMRKMAVEELKERGEDVSKIKIEEPKEEETKTKDKPEEKAPPTDWKDTEAINEHFTGSPTAKKSSKEQRIKIDDHIHSLKTKDKDYKPVQKQIEGLNASYARFLKSKSPLMISSGGAGLGKTYNFKAVAKFMGLKPYKETDEPGSEDYDYFEAPETKTAPNLVELLKNHNGKTIVFDDSDEVFKNPDNLGILKKATASSGDRIVGWKSKSESNIDPFNFTGQILIITNENQSYFTKNPHIDAVYSRAIKNDIQATKKEKLDSMGSMIHKMDFHGIERQGKKEDDVAEREEAFKILKKNIDKVDPGKFSSRTFKEILEKKRSIDDANELIKKDPVMGKMLFGEPGDWKKEVEDYLTKGISTEFITLEKALINLDLEK